MRFGTSLVVVCLAIVLAATARSAGAASERTALIRPAQGIGKLRLGMSQAEVRRAMGPPQFVVQGPASFGLRSIEYQWDYARYTVRLFGPRGTLRAVRVGTTARRERTAQGVGVNTSERSLLRTYPRLRCEPLRTQRYGSIRLVTTVQRECTLFGHSGRRTIFTTDVRERAYEVVTPGIWSQRARVIEVSVAAPS